MENTNIILYTYVYVNCMESSSEIEIDVRRQPSPTRAFKRTEQNLSWWLVGWVRCSKGEGRII